MCREINLLSKMPLPSLGGDNIGFSATESLVNSISDSVVSEKPSRMIDSSKDININIPIQQYIGYIDDFLNWR